MDTMTREIRPEVWPAYWEDLSRLYEGWWVTIEELGREFGDQRLADRLPLQGISFELIGSEAGAILIQAGDSPSTFMMHHVLRPRSVWVADTQPGAGADLRIEAATGEITLVHLSRPAALPSPGALGTPLVGERRRAPRFSIMSPTQRGPESLSSTLVLALAAAALVGVAIGLFAWSRSKSDPHRPHAS